MAKLDICSYCNRLDLVAVTTKGTCVCKMCRILGEQADFVETMRLMGDGENYYQIVRYRHHEAKYDTN